MYPVEERFYRYISIDTTSIDEAGCYPSTPNQWKLARILEQELNELGLSEVNVDQYGYVTASIPANRPDLPVVGLIAHMDTSDAVPGGPIKARTIEYQGGDIFLGEESGLSLTEKDFPELKRYIGQHLIVSDGTTLLGADDKAGVAEIMTAAQILMENPDIPHGKIKIAFTPDEEIGEGTSYFDVKAFGADYAYTVDGGPLGELEYENFNAATAIVTIKGYSMHPGSSKGRMVNALLIAGEFQNMLPAHEIPACTEGYEGFYHLMEVNGSVTDVTMHYIIRDHSWDEFENRKARMEKITSYLNEKYGDETISLQQKDSYYNMKEIISQHMHLITRAENAFAKCGVIAAKIPIRGGTDGARLSFMGLPCPNLSTGGHNFHSVQEFVPVEAMETMSRVLVEIVRSFVWE